APAAGRAPRGGLAAPVRPRMARRRADQHSLGLLDHLETRCYARPMERHFTVSGFVSQSGKTALHFHGIVNLWLPPGGHGEAAEAPTRAVQREVLEETSISVEVVSTGRAYQWAEPGRLAPPATIGVYNIPGDSHQREPHQHIDFVYFTRPVAGASLEL